MASVHKERIEKLKTILKQDSINITELQQIATQGIPDESNLRSICWRLLLDYLPRQRNEWKEHLRKQRSVYDSLIKELIINTGREKPSRDAVCDHPLNPNPESAWSVFFKDNEVLLQIDKDVRRLCPELAFFQQPTEFPSKLMAEHKDEVGTLSERVESIMLESEIFVCDRSGASNLVSKKKAQTEYKALPRGQEAHWEVVQRILFIYAKLNPGVKYVQGMNEILGPIYFVMASDVDIEWRAWGEADAFFCFQNLMSEIKDHFIKTLDSSSCGIESTMTSLYDLLEEKDPIMYSHLTQELELRPQFYAFRWMSLLLSQEFLLPDVIQIWDSLFSDPKRFDFLKYLCCAMIISLRDQMLEGDFSVCMKLLQNFPSTDVGGLIVLGKRLMDPGFIVSVPNSPSQLNNAATRLKEENKKFWSNLTRGISNAI